MSESASWAPQCIKEAFCGVARRPSGTGEIEEYPVYNWQQSVKCLRAATMSREEAAAVTCDPRAIWLMVVSRNEYWKACRKRNMRVWEGLQPACVGIGVRDGNRAAVYSKRLTLRVLEEGFVDAGVPMQASTIRLRAIEQFNEICNIYLGPSTPFFLP